MKPRNTVSETVMEPSSDAMEGDDGDDDDDMDYPVNECGR
jgi:hypothetical protein